MPKSETWCTKYRASSTPGPVKQMDRRQGAITPRGDGRWRGVVLRNPRYFSPCTPNHLSLPPSQLLCLPARIEPARFAEGPSPWQIGGYKQPKASPSPGMSGSLPHAHANTHTEPGPFPEIVSHPHLQAAIDDDTSNARGLTSPPQQAASSLMLLKSRQPAGKVASPLHRLPRVNGDKNHFTLCRSEKSKVTQNSAGWQAPGGQASLCPHKCQWMQICRKTNRVYISKSSKLSGAADE